MKKEAFKSFLTSDKNAHSLVTLARKRDLGQLRVSGGEPTIGKSHLLQVLERLEGKGYRFILETNGIPIAYDENYAEEISKYDFVHVRVSLKGCNEEEFSMLTGAKPEGFKLQLKSLEKLVEADVSYHPSIMASFSLRKNLDALIERLGRISPELAMEVEIEELILYSHVVERLNKAGIKMVIAFRPDEIPKELV